MIRNSVPESFLSSIQPSICSMRIFTSWSPRESVFLKSKFSVYGFEKTNINLDWTSIVLHGTEANLGKFGYSRDHRTDKLQITVGISELVNPINIPIGITV